jgi:hypothetical protein
LQVSEDSERSVPITPDKLSVTGAKINNPDKRDKRLSQIIFLQRKTKLSTLFTD